MNSTIQHVTIAGVHLTHITCTVCTCDCQLCLSVCLPDSLYVCLSI